jgi:multiple sugar transport system substrate-binding protein
VAAAWILMAAAVGVASPGKEAASSGPVTLRYANWNLGTADEPNLERQILAAWNAANPNIQVQVDDKIDPAKWMESLAAAAAAGTLPDVMAVTNIGEYLANEWLADIGAQAGADAEWKTLPAPIAASVVFDGKTYAVPFGMFLFGFFVNKDIMEKENMRVPDTSWTMADFETIARTLAKPDRPLLGLTEELDIPNWYPAAVSNNLGWYTWDGKAYHLDSKEFRDGMALARRLFTSKYVYDTLPEDKKTLIGAAWHGEAWDKGYAALRWDGTWAIAAFTERPFQWDFLGIPGGRPVIIPDYLGIAASTKAQKQAFEFAKWMSSFSKAGYLKRLEIARANPDTPALRVNSLPLTKDREVVDAFFRMVNIPGLRATFSRLDSGIVESFKPVPGYVQSRWQAQATADMKVEDVIEGSIRGDLKYEDFAAQLNKLANDKYQAAVADLPR